MHSSEYEDLLASLQKIVRQAYDLGRSEALRQVVEVLKTDPVPPKPLALAAPTPAPQAPAPQASEPPPASPPIYAPAPAPTPTPTPTTLPAQAPDAVANHSSMPPTTHTRGMPDQAPVRNSAPAEPTKDVSAVGILDTPAKTPQAPARSEDKPSVPWWAR